MKDSISYEDLREAALRFDQCTIRWTQSMSVGASVSNSDGAVPMEVDRVEKGKSGGKKGKSKMGAKAKTKERANTKARRLVRKAIKLAQAMETIFRQVHGKIDRILHNRLDGVASLTAQARVQSLARVLKEKTVARTMIRDVIVAGSLDILLGLSCAFGR